MGHEQHHEQHHEEEEKLRFIASPLKHTEPSRNVSNSDSDIEAPKHGANASNQEVPWDRDGELHQTPAFHRHEAAQSIELFYDLFFVANLTTFTANHNINTVNTLSSYTGFFCILWFTWYQATLYDVRFAVDSVVERIFKLINFGVMMGFAIVGSSFDPDNVAYSTKTFKTLTLILMASRLALVAQYSFTLFWTRKHRQVFMPLLMVIGMSFVAAMVYMGLFFAFKEGQSTRAYVAWYVVAVLETAMTTIVSCKWRSISFKGTHLQERLSLLTLIILGEGIILLCKSISYIIKGYWVFTSDTIGSIICALLIIYLFYMIYFDRVVEHHFGTIKQQIWAFAHFPFHIALVLVLEGTRQFVIWRQAIAAIVGIFNNVFYYDFSEPRTPEYFTEAVTYISEYAANVFYYIEDIDLTSYNATINEQLDIIWNTMNGTLGVDADGYYTEDSSNIILAQYMIRDTLANAEMAVLGMKPVKTKDGSKPDASSTYSSYLGIFNMIFIYFFVTAGLTLILAGVLHWIATPPKKLGDYIRGASNFVIGLGLCLISTMAAKPDLTYNDGPLERFQFSPWILPTLVIALFINVILNHVRRPSFLKKHN